MTFIVKVCLKAWRLWCDDPCRSSLTDASQVFVLWKLQAKYNSDMFIIDELEACPLMLALWFSISADRKAEHPNEVWKIVLMKMLREKRIQGFCC